MPSPSTPARILRDPAERVSPRAPLMWFLGALIGGLVLLGAALAVQLLWLDWPWWAYALLVVVVAGYVVVMPQWRYRVHRWEVTDTAVYTQTGWWTRERRIAPMSRIQTVDYSQGALSRIFGLASVTVTTASAAGALEIAGLEAGRAQALAEDLTHKAHVVPGDAT
ncbi:PH domain-containing protein [Nocardioides insulae]|uniref:PH domain-containing protein n=1 Tax=Nocardioides insulae TaxID=394734 RepID=UPI00040BD79B|nr:PH domain-containing protein [Nocardioides insulae]